jgi:RNA polymerase sigma-70 factor (ECF subfamily)
MAEDCVQDSILKTYLAREEIKNESQWRSWLFVTIRNRAVDMIRKAENNGIYIEKVKTDGEWSDDDVSLDIVEQETVDIIYTAVQSLPEIYRQIFELSFEQALRNSEVAEQLAIAEITVKKRKARLLELLRQRLGRSISEEYILMLLSMQLADSV